MTIPEICEKFIDSIKREKSHDPVKLNGILKDNNYELNFNCMNKLSEYSDEAMDDGWAERWQLKMTNKYGEMI